MAMRVGVHFLAAAALLAATSMAASYLQREKPRKPGRPLAAFPATLGSWNLDRTDVVPARVVERLRCTDFLARSYSSRNREASLFIAYYAEQRAGAGTHSPKSCLPGAGWEIWNYATERVDVNGLAETINRYSIQNQQERAAGVLLVPKRETYRLQRVPGKGLSAFRRADETGPGRVAGAGDRAGQT